MAHFEGLIKVGWLQMRYGDKMANLDLTRLNSSSTTLFFQPLTLHSLHALLATETEYHLQQIDTSPVPHPTSIPSHVVPALPLNNGSPSKPPLAGAGLY